MYSDPGGFSNGYVPLFIVIGPNYEVYSIGNGPFLGGVESMLRQAIDAFGD